MKPISVRFQCFGPYVQEQFIDFQDLQKSGLFLICGETGAGKTTILDAMCYALYGKSSGGARGNLQDMRCKRADPGDETFVEYIFRSEENTYQFYRGIKPRKQRKTSQEAGKAQTFNEEYSCRILKDGEFVPMSDTKALQSYMDKKAEEILGLKYEQFKQVIILPQGQFEKLLTSDSDEKEKILVKLFKADKYEKISRYMVDKLLEKEKSLKLQKALMDEKLRGFACGNLEELALLSEKTAGECGALQEQYTALEEEIQRKKETLDQAKKDDEGFRALEKAEKVLADLKRQQDQIGLEKQKLQMARNAETVTPAYGAYQDCQKKSRAADKDRLERENMRKVAEKRVQELQEEKRAHEDGRAAYEEQKTRKIRLEGLKELYAALWDKEKACKDAENQQDQARKNFEKAEKNITAAENNFQQATRKQKQTESAFHQGQDAYFRNIGATLAKDLQEGEMCPVCGSCHHPRLAEPMEDGISEKEFDLLMKANRKAMKELEDCLSARGKAKDEKQAAELALAACEKDRESAEKIYREALSQRAEGIDTEKQRLEALKVLAENIEDFEDADRSMQDKINTADSNFKMETERCGDAIREAEAAAEARKAAERDWVSAAADAGFADISSYLAACMKPGDVQELQVRIIQIETDLKNAEKDVKEKKTALIDRVRPDVAGANEALASAEKQKEAVSNALGLQKKALENQEKALESLQKDMAQWDQKDQKNRENLVFAKRLRGDNSISLQRYVLGVMLTSITNAANQLLKTVYGGRYQLYRTNEAVNGKQKRGLALMVADQDGMRSVNSLSGGEKFLLSLSLGIGLATVVQAQGNGIRLEAMFIDEGFGSLDEKSIDDALEILETVRSGSGMVGIISHVERLAETIPAKIQITKTKEGSQCKVCC